MTEASYVAWDDNLYEWPPPEGWYESSDGKWWPEGYGPGQADGLDSAATASTPGASTPTPSEAAPASGSVAKPADADEPEAFLGLGLDQTSVLPAGGVSSLLAAADDQDDAGSQRPVYDELPPIDDIFGLAGDDDDDEPDADDEGTVGADSVDDGPAGEFLDDGQADDQDADDGEGGVGPAGDRAHGDVTPDELLSNGDLGGNDQPESGDTGFAISDSAESELQTEALEGPLHVDDEFQVADHYEAEVGVDHDDAADAPPDNEVGYDADDDGGQGLGEPSDPNDGYDGDDDDRYYQDEDDDGYVDDDGHHDQAAADGREAGEFDHGDADNGSGAANDGYLAAEPDASESINAVDDRFSAAEATVVVDDIVTQVASGESAAPSASETTAAVGAETVVVESPSPSPSSTPTVISGEPAARSPLGADLTQTIVGGDDATSIGLDVGYGDSTPGEEDPDGYELPRTARWPLVIGGLLLLAMAGVVAFLIGNAEEPVESAPESTIVSSGPGSLGEPYEFGTGVVVFYDIGADQNRWVFQVIEPVADLTEDLTAAGVAAPDGNDILAAARVRITFNSGVATGPLADLGLDSVAVPDTIFPALADCGPDSLDPTATLEAEQSVEATVCWAIPPSQLPSLILGVTAGPADGTVHLALR